MFHPFQTFITVKGEGLGHGVYPGTLLKLRSTIRNYGLVTFVCHNTISYLLTNTMGMIEALFQFYLQSTTNPLQ